MNYKQIAKEAEEGKLLLKQGIFPNKIIEVVKEERLRKDLSDKIFYPNGRVAHSELSDEEKRTRTKRLKVELAFVRYMEALNGFRKTAFIALIVGCIMFFFSTIRDNGNFPFGIISVLTGVAIFLLTFSNANTLKFAKILLIGFAAILIVEFAIFNLPNPVLSNVIDSDILVSKRGAIAKIMNEMSPYLYLVSKVSILGYMAFSLSSINAFKKEKEKFEKK